MTKLIVDTEFGTFRPEEYLAEYYSSIGLETRQTLGFMASASKLIGDNLEILEYGGGPTIYQLISIAPHCRSIVFTDYLKSNLGTVKEWVDGKDTHDWDKFAFESLLMENGYSPSKEEIDTRLELVKGKITSFNTVNALNASEDELTAGVQFDVVSSHFVAESISSTEKQWKTAMQNTRERIKPGGYLLMSVIQNAEYWVSGGKKYPSYPVDYSKLHRELSALGFEVISEGNVVADIADPLDPNYEGYDGFLFVLARKLV